MNLNIFKLGIKHEENNKPDPEYPIITDIKTGQVIDIDEIINNCDLH